MRKLCLALILALVGSIAFSGTPALALSNSSNAVQQTALTKKKKKHKKKHHKHKTTSSSTATN
jgi:hypothetical protein